MATNRPGVRGRRRPRGPVRESYCLHCGRGAGLELADLPEGRAATLCADCRPRLAKALDGAPEWAWLLRSLSAVLARREGGS